MHFSCIGFQSELQVFYAFLLSQQVRFKKPCILNSQPEYHKNHYGLRCNPGEVKKLKFLEKRKGDLTTECSLQFTKTFVLKLKSQHIQLIKIHQLDITQEHLKFNQILKFKDQLMILFRFLVLTFGMVCLKDFLKALQGIKRPFMFAGIHK